MKSPCVSPHYLSAAVLSTLLVSFLGLYLPLINSIVLPLLVIACFALFAYWNTLSKTARVTSSIVLIAAGYLVLPTLFIIDVYNPHHAPINGSATIDTPSVLPTHSTTYSGQRIFFLLSQGRHIITFGGSYREPQREEIAFRLVPFVYKKIALKPASFTFQNVSFIDPYGLEHTPSVELLGSTIDGEAYTARGDTATPFVFGTYEAHFETPYLENTTRITPDLPSTISVFPGRKSVVFSEHEAQQISNYVRDYLDLSAQKIIAQEGFPKQYHSYRHNATLSLGDMLFLICQLNKAEHPVLYVPRSLRYELGGSDDCYTAIKSGVLPAIINSTRAEQAVYESLSSVARTLPYSFGELNQKNHALDWALSYDVEYGRYVPKVGVTEHTHSTCAIAPDYLPSEYCGDADAAGWYTDSPEVWWNNEYEYPVSSGMIGWRTILELGSEYGIPTTQYLVTKDIELFKDRDPKLFERSYELVHDGLVEIGSHTRYHTRLDTVSPEFATQELLLSREELEKMYDAPATGMRMPYLSLVNGTIPDTERALAETGYSYYSIYGNHSLNDYDGKTIEHKPINFYGYLGYASPAHLDSAFSNLKSVISLDHPWNIQFKETEEPIVLEENPRQPVQMKALILQAMSRGAHFTTVKNITLS